MTEMPKLIGLPVIGAYPTAVQLFEQYFWVRYATQFSV
jgi:hypothetical protein